jgi:pyrimidine-specific ribonucleoside hydrolase
MVPVILDTDPGVDDAFAIALAVASPELDLRAVTTSFGNVSLSTATVNALRLLALLGRDDIAVAAGADRPLVYPHPRSAGHVHGADGLSGHAATLPAPRRSVETSDAVTVMARVLRTSTSPVTIVAIGPLTNVATLLTTHPDAVINIDRLIVLGGGVGMGNVTAAAEFNIWSDPEAARRVLVEQRLNTVLVPINLTHQCGVGEAWINRLRSAGAIGRTLAQIAAPYQAWQREQQGSDGLVLHDAVAVAEAARPGVLNTTAYQLDVDCSQGDARGALIAQRHLDGHPGDPAGRTVDIATETDVAALTTFMLNRLMALR